MKTERGVAVDHSSINRWVLKFAPELDKRIRPFLNPTNGSWRVDETYIEVKGEWKYLYRAVDSEGNTLDFILSAKRDGKAAARFFRKVLRAKHTQTPRVITVDKNAAYPVAVDELKQDQTLKAETELRQRKYLNNINYEAVNVSNKFVACSLAAVPNFFHYKSFILLFKMIFSLPITFFCI